MAESISEGTLKTWQKKVGDTVEADEEVATIETDKVCTTATPLMTSRLSRPVSRIDLLTHPFLSRQSVLEPTSEMVSLADISVSPSYRLTCPSTHQPPAK